MRPTLFSMAPQIGANVGRQLGNDVLLQCAVGRERRGEEQQVCWPGDKQELGEGRWSSSEEEVRWHGLDKAEAAA
ncbi:hypothetical protein GUJ93_ZPchr0009g2457 [Zizania palustris]|uniref:Uncharacterized protein n=1 Tax=Zizania palustris TaxID=103762 RepID=A0A8J5RQU8_ZIZPA|nr:hypothetical protein GUJ93_ZPchr0009g2457 [Zizania palustris]